MSKPSYSFAARVDVYAGAAAWRFVILPYEMSLEIRGHLKHEEQGWGRLKCAAETGLMRWETAIWFDTKHEAYILPIKAIVRQKEGVKDGDEIWVNIYL